jgi:hypothetical protein
VSGSNEFAHMSVDVESMSDSKAAEAAVQVNGRGLARLELWLTRQRAFTSKGSSRDTEVEAVGLTELGLSLKWLRFEAFMAKAERRLDSLAVTGLTHPWSSVEAMAVDPAPVTASGPVQSKLWAEGLPGLRR